MIVARSMASAIGLLFTSGIVIATVPSVAIAENLSSCTSSLSDLEDGAREAHSSAEEAESECQEYEDCRTFPEVYDLLEDGCELSRMGCHSAVNSLNAELAGLALTVSFVERACGLDFSEASSRLLQELERQSKPPTTPPTKAK